MEDNGDLQQNMFLEMMKHHISNGLAFSYPATCKRFTENIHSMCRSISVASDGENSSNIDPDLDEHESLPTPVVYKKRARIKFTQHQVKYIASFACSSLIFDANLSWIHWKQHFNNIVIQRSI